MLYKEKEILTRTWQNCIRNYLIPSIYTSDERVVVIWCFSTFSFIKEEYFYVHKQLCKNNGRPTI